MKFYKPTKWHFRYNKNRNSNRIKKHSTLIVGKTKDNKKLLNIGITHSKYRGHHKNIEIKGPSNWNKISYLRDDIKLDDIDKLENILKEYKIHKNDIEKILKIILKYKKKNSL